MRQAGQINKPPLINSIMKFLTCFLLSALLGRIILASDSNFINCISESLRVEGEERRAGGSSSSNPESSTPTPKTPSKEIHGVKKSKIRKLTSSREEKDTSAFLDHAFDLVQFVNLENQSFAQDASMIRQSGIAAKVVIKNDAAGNGLKRKASEPVDTDQRSKRRNIEACNSPKLAAAPASNPSNNINNLMPKTFSATSETFPKTTSLHKASARGNVAKVAKLLESGTIRVNAITNTGHTALHVAVEAGQVEVVRLLMQWKADMQIRDFQRSLTPLEMALHRDHEASASQADHTVLSVMLQAMAVDRIAEFLNEHTSNIKDSDPFHHVLQQISWKNRYKDIIPFSHNRIVLDGDKSDGERVDPGGYINASPLSYDKDPRGVRYIATQEPLPQTRRDFWRMVWEQDSRAVVSLLSISDPFWPTSPDRPLIFGDIVVSLDGQTDMASSKLTLRTFSLSSQGEEKQNKTVTQYHFHGWPDKSIPIQAEFIGFLEVFQKTVELNAEHPAIIHCSAGVGRTGTLAAVDIITNIIKTDEALRQSLGNGRKDRIQELVFKVAYQLRSQRFMSIQTTGQLGFVEDVIAALLANNNLQ